MTTNITTRTGLLDLIGHASLSGYLGLFVGTGLSIAATNGTAPSFEQLLRSVIGRLQLRANIDTDPAYRLKSLPQVASKLLEDVAAVTSPPERAGERFREEIADLCNLHPIQEVRTRLTGALRRLQPAWLITTNYDLLLETLLDDAPSLLPDQPLVSSPQHPPIYHLHGHRLNPSTIKITEEDYVNLLGPIDYQRLKLPLLLVESTTLMLGYALGDINVRAAIQWSQSFRGTKGLRLSHGQGTVVQALFKTTTPRNEPYVGANGEFILEIVDIPSFLEELGARRDALAASLQQYRAQIEQFLSDSSTAAAVAVEGPARQSFLEFLQAALPFAQATRLIEFLNQALEPIWEKARQDRGWEYYNTYLKLLLEILTRLDVRTCYPGLLGYLADALERVGWYIAPANYPGMAFAASDTWRLQHTRLSETLKRELMSYATVNGKFGLFKMLSAAGVPGDWLRR